MEIGGYFELELLKGHEYHRHAIRLNSGRNAFEFILMAKGYKKVYLPYFNCHSMLQPIDRLGLKVEFYHIDKSLLPDFDFAKVLMDEVFVFTNYFGICDVQVKKVMGKCQNLIVDNAQAFFSKPLPKVDTFYSPRKFFGVPDGGYLYTDTKLKESLPKDTSGDRFKHLIGRIEYSASQYYEEFKKNNKSFINQPIKSMSNITRRILSSINYGLVKSRRIKNFKYLHSKLAAKNQFKYKFNEEMVPLVYPFLSDKSGLRQYLNNQKIYVAQYWPNVLQWVGEQHLEHQFAENLVHLPIDQRYSKVEMDYIIGFIERWK